MRIVSVIILGLGLLPDAARAEGTIVPGLTQHVVQFDILGPDFTFISDGCSGRACVTDTECAVSESGAGWSASISGWGASGISDSLLYANLGGEIVASNSTPDKATQADLFNSFCRELFVIGAPVTLEVDVQFTTTPVSSGEASSSSELYFFISPLDDPNSPFFGASDPFALSINEPLTLQPGEYLVSAGIVVGLNVLPTVTAGASNSAAVTASGSAAGPANGDQSYVIRTLPISSNCGQLGGCSITFEGASSGIAGAAEPTPLGLDGTIDVELTEELCENTGVATAFGRIADVDLAVTDPFIDVPLADGSTARFTNVQIGLNGAAPPDPVDATSGVLPAYVAITGDVEIIPPGGAAREGGGLTTTLLALFVAECLTCFNGDPETCNPRALAGTDVPPLDLDAISLPGIDLVLELDLGLGELDPVIRIAGDLASPPAPCPADVTGDDAVDVLDLLVVLAEWGGPGSADIAGPAGDEPDGIVNVLDLLALLSLWGPCP